MPAAWILLSDEELNAWANDGSDWGGELWWVAMKGNHGQQQGVQGGEGDRTKGRTDADLDHIGHDTVMKHFN